MRGPMSAAATPRELSVLTRLATPIVITQLGSMAMGAVDVLMLGHYSSDALAASSLGRIWIMGTQLIAQGVLFGIDPLVAQGFGARNPRAISMAFQRGLILAVLVSLPLLLGWLLTAEVLLANDIDPLLAQDAELYALGRIPGALFYLLFMAMRSWLQGRRILAPALFVVVAGNLVNWLANLLLINGAGPVPELGILGAGLATSATQIALFGGLWWFVRRFRLQRGGWTGWSRDVWNARELGRVMRIGIPIALQLGLEVWAFQAATLRSGQLGQREVAAHAVVMTLASIAFMVPLGIGMGAQTRVGNLIGAGRPEQARLAARTALRAGATLMFLFALVLIFGDDWLPTLFSSDHAVLAYAAVALPVAGLFQLFDGVQVIASCILRGAGRTSVPVLCNLLAYYGIGLPLGSYWAFTRDWGFPGVWLGLAVGLASAAPLLVVYVAYVFRPAGADRLRV